MGSFRSNSFANVRIFSEIPTIYKHFLFVFFQFYHKITKFDQQLTTGNAAPSKTE